MLKSELVKDRLYNWKHQPDQMVYIGTQGKWHQFRKLGDPRPVWCEITDNELPLIEATSTEKLDKAVLEAATNAHENGYRHWLEADELAADMATCDSELEVYEPSIIADSITRQGLLVRCPVGYEIRLPSGADPVG